MAQLAAVLLTGIHIAMPATLIAQRRSAPHPTSDVANVAIVPFEVSYNGFVFVRVQLDGREGTMLLDTGCPMLLLNPAAAPPPSRPANLSEFTGRFLPEGPTGWTPAMVRTITIGTMTAVLDTVRATRATTTPLIAGYWPHSGFGGLSDAIGKPIMGLLGVEGLAPFETIIDYPRRQVTFIRLDARGRRLGTVPQLKVATRIPLARASVGEFGFLRNWSVGEIVDTTMLQLDTGAPMNSMSETQQQAWASHLTPAPATAYDLDGEGTWTDTLWTLDRMTAVGVRYDSLNFGVLRPGQTPGEGTLSLLGAPFLRRLGIVGFNFRTRQLTVYEPSTTDLPSEPGASTTATGSLFPNAPEPVIATMTDTAQQRLTPQILAKLTAFMKEYVSDLPTIIPLLRRYRILVPLPAVHIKNLQNHPAPKPVDMTDMVAFAAHVPQVAGYFRKVGLTPQDYEQWRFSMNAAYCTWKADRAVNGETGALDTTSLTGWNAAFLFDHAEEVEVLVSVGWSFPSCEMVLEAIHPSPRTGVPRLREPPS